MPNGTMKERSSTPPVRWKMVPPGLKQMVKRTLKPMHLLTGPIRLLPDFIIFGAPRCGTTSLYNYLIQHPRIAPPYKKEVHFFDINYSKGRTWYRAHFPSSIYKRYVKTARQQDLITGESSPSYIWYPHTPKRVFETVPRVKLIALLRNPVDQVYSHYQMNIIRWGKETLSFEEAIDKEEQRVQGEMEKMLADESYFSETHSRLSYLSGAVYVDQLKPWFELFPREQILILRSEDFYVDPPSVFKQVLDFLGLPVLKLKDSRKHHSLRYDTMEAATRKRLLEYFEPHNQRLYEYLGVNFGWDR
jgi:hypothetical protein